MSLHVFILAAGRGSRLKALEPETPKWLLEIGGRPIADRHLEGIEQASEHVSSVRVVTGHAAKAIDAYLESRDVTPLYNPEYLPLNNWYSVLLALQESPRAERIAFINSDLFVTPEVVARFLAEAATTEQEALIAVDLERELTDESMKVSVTQQQTVQRIGKVGIEDPRGEYIGMLMASGSVLEAFRTDLERFVGVPEAANEWYEGAVDRNAQAGVPWTIWPVPSGDWVEIDDDGDLAKALELVPS